MADTIREQIISAYLTRLAAWITTNGFNYNCGNSVGRAAASIEPNDLPACVLWPQQEEITNPYGYNTCEMVLKIEAFVEIDGANPSVIQEKLLGDAIVIMTRTAVSVTTKIEDIAYIAGGPAGIVKSEEKVTGIFANFKIKYDTKLGDPYSQ